MVVINDMLQIEKLRLGELRQLVSNNQLMETRLVPLISISIFLLFFFLTCCFSSFEVASPYLLFCHNLLNHSAIFHQLGYLLILGIINNEAMNITVLTDSPPIFGLSPWNRVPEVELLG